MEKAEKTKGRIILTALLGLATVFLFYYGLSWNQNIVVMNQAQEEIKESMTHLEDSIGEARKPFERIATSTESLYEEILCILCDFAKLEDGFKISDAWQEKINSYFNYVDIVIADRKGNILASAQDQLKDVKGGAFDPIRKTFEDGLMCSMQHDVMIKTALDKEEEASGIIAETEESTQNTAEAKTEDTGDVSDRNINCWLYAMAFDDDHEFIISEYEWLDSLIGSEKVLWTILMDDEQIMQQGYAFVWADDTKQLLYYPDSGKVGKRAEELGLNPDTIKDDQFRWMNVDGERMYVYTRHLVKSGVWIAYVIPEQEIEGARVFNRILLTVSFVLFCAVLVYYAILLIRQKKVKVLTDFTGSGKMHGHRNRKYKYMVFVILLTMLLFLMTFYLQTLYLMSTWAESASNQTDQLRKSMEEQEAIAKECIEQYHDRKMLELDLLASFFASNPKAWTPAVLDTFANEIRAYHIRILNTDGSIRAESTSYITPDLKGMTDAASPSPEEGEATTEEDDEKPVSEWMKEGRTDTVPLTDDDGTASGCLEVSYYSHEVNEALDSFSLKSILNRIQPGRNGFVFAIDPSTNTFSSFPDEGLIGKNALEYGMTENQIKDNFCDYISINGSVYYAATDRIGKNLIYFAVLKKDLLAGRLPISLQISVLVFVLFLTVGIPLFTSREQIEMVKAERERHSFSEDRNSPEYRVLRVLMYYAVGTAAFLAAYSSFRASAGPDGVIGYVLDGKWERGFNVFALSSAVFILSRGGVVLFVFSKMIRMVGDILPIRGGTILKVLGSLATYVAIAFLIYQCMLCFGLNPTALVASAGIVSVVLGIGANSLVGDILAGVFLLVEGNVQVGDVVQIGDYRGYVMDLGIRMTKLFDMDSENVKIIPNNEVRNVVHMTMRSSIVYSEFQICYEEDLKTIEKILQTELKNVTGKSSLILNGPVYIGVNRLDDSGVVLTTATRCHESSRRKVEREVNHIVYSIFQKNNISVPFPQVTIHQADGNPPQREDGDSQELS